MLAVAEGTPQEKKERSEILYRNVVRGIVYRNTRQGRRPINVNSVLAAVLGLRRSATE